MKNHGITRVLMGLAVVFFACLPLAGCQPKAAEMERPAGIDTKLVGLWSALQPQNGDVDPKRRRIAPAACTPEWYLFDRDGSYKHGIVMTGGGAGGLIIMEGRYVAHDGHIDFADCTASYFPTQRTGPAYQDMPTREGERRYGFETRLGGETRHLRPRKPQALQSGKRRVCMSYEARPRRVIVVAPCPHRADRISPGAIPGAIRGTDVSPDELPG